jgi:hypothetical protein
MKRDELTRWNRAGLARLEYVHGNAASFLETLRAGFAGQPELTRWERVMGPPPDERDETRRERLLDQYRTPTRDPAWEIARALARASQVLAGHVDAEANEGYLGTATLWERVRQLVTMIDYIPAPPASAATPLVLLAREGRDGRIPAGLAVRHQPLEGGPLTFETLEDIDVHASLNALRLAGHDRSPAPLCGDELELPGKPGDVRADEPLVLEDEVEGRLRVCRVAGVSEVAPGWLRVRLAEGLGERHGFVRGQTRVHHGVRERPTLLGPVPEVAAPLAARRLRLAEPPPPLDPGDVVYLGPAADPADRFRRVVAREARAVILDRPLDWLDFRHGHLAKARRLAVSGVIGRELEGQAGGVVRLKVAGDLRDLAGSWVARPGSDRELKAYRILGVEYRPADPDVAHAGFSLLRIQDSTQDPLLGESQRGNPQYVMAAPPSRGVPFEPFVRNDRCRPLDQQLEVRGGRDAEAGGLVVVQRGQQFACGRLESVASLEGERRRLTVAGWAHRGGGRFWLGDSVLHCGFRHVSRPRGWDRNEGLVTGPGLVLETLPAELGRGRRVLVAGAAGRAVEAEVERVDAQGRVFLSPSLDDLGLRVSEVVIHGNVVAAGHGEARPERVYGGVDITPQGLPVALKDVAFTADRQLPGGVRAALEVRVEGEHWEQVGQLHDAGPEDRHYTVRYTEDGDLLLGFGDGERGRRVPARRGNVRIGWREGSGPVGNLPPGSLERLARPDPRLSGVRQPLPAVGGNAVEDSESLRRSAPATLLTFDRAVSLADFAALATSHSSVWRARARPGPARTRRARAVTVVVLPAGGEASPHLLASLSAYLQSHVAPGIRVGLVEAAPVAIHLRARLRLDTAAFDPDTVVEAVRRVLQGALTLAERDIGEPLTIAEVFRYIEAVDGVVNSRCAIGRDRMPALDSGLRQVPAGVDEVLHLPLAAGHLAIDWEEATP